MFKLQNADFSKAVSERKILISINLLMMNFVRNLIKPLFIQVDILFLTINFERVHECYMEDSVNSK